MTHGVCPPLTARTKRPRAAIDARASAAIVAAAARATASTSSNTSSFIAFLQVRSACQASHWSLRALPTVLRRPAPSDRLGDDAEIFLVRGGRIMPHPGGGKALGALSSR